MPGAGAEDVATAGDGAHRAVARQRPAARGSSSPPRPTRCRWSSPSSSSAPTSRRRSRPSTAARSTATLPEGVEPRVTALNINDQPVIVATIGAGGRAATRSRRRASRGRCCCPRSAPSTGVIVGGPDRWRHDVAAHHARPGRAWPTHGHRLTAGHGRPPGQPDDHPFGHACRGRPPAAGHRRAASLQRRSRSSRIAGRAAPMPGDPPDPGDPGRDRGRDGREVQHVGLRAHQRRAVAHADRLARPPAPTRCEVADAVQAAFADIEARHPGQVSRRHHRGPLADFIKESRDGLVREGLLGAALRGPDHLPVPAQPALDARRGGEHPAVDPHRADRSWASPA